MHTACNSMHYIVKAKRQRKRLGTHPKGLLWKGSTLTMDILQPTILCAVHRLSGRQHRRMTALWNCVPFFSTSNFALWTATDVWARGSKFNTQCYDRVVCPNRIHTCNTMYSASAAAGRNGSNKKKCVNWNELWSVQSWAEVRSGANTSEAGAWSLKMYVFVVDAICNKYWKCRTKTSSLVLVVGLT